ncbi:hypothetical protein AAFF_G00388330 [Aldrovandia affinis]|uniref:Uncharacterized protein n=1 Tax=Aldrovandia affinis TaxID=143900 RepID=A0AAD7SEU1_9TELE|nr:hypothetical protein AAFF_G00388330 [Aldrovandia affinis]
MRQKRFVDTGITELFTELSEWTRMPLGTDREPEVKPHTLTANCSSFVCVRAGGGVLKDSQSTPTQIRIGLVNVEMRKPRAQATGPLS